MIEVWSDGSGTTQGRPGGYGWVICRDGRVLLGGFGSDHCTTSNRMELAGALAGLRALDAFGCWAAPEPVWLISDSEYALYAASGHNAAEKNVDLIAPLKELFRKFGAGVRHVRGHQLKRSVPWRSQGRDALLNERCDMLAKHGRKLAEAGCRKPADAPIDSAVLGRNLEEYQARLKVRREALRAAELRRLEWREEKRRT
jgi:ribonuclease HI